MNLRWRLSHTRGYLALGMLREAEAELKAIPREQADDDEVRALTVALWHEKKDWRRLRRVAGMLVKREPTRIEWWVSLAYATRRVGSVEQARAILLQAERLHPREAIVQFNLGCYACLMGDLAEARERVLRAIGLEPSFRDTAREDPDLEPLRREDGNFPGG